MLTERERERALAQAKPAPASPGPANTNTVTTDLYESMPYDDDPVEVQELTIPDFYAVIDDPDTGLEARRVDSVIAMDDGTMFDTLEDGRSPDEEAGFLGYLLGDVTGKTDEELREALKATELQEDA